MIPDDDGSEEEDGYDETLGPVDHHESGPIRDDDIYEILANPLPNDVHMVCLFDSYHSGMVMDLPYIFKADGIFTEMDMGQSFTFKKLFHKFGIMTMNKIQDFLDDE
jgi:hypothetical protein